MDKWYPASGIAVPCFRNCGTRKLEWRCNLGRILHPSQLREIFNEDDSLLCALDRIFDDATVFTIRGQSYRGRRLEKVYLQIGKFPKKSLPDDSTTD